MTDTYFLIDADNTIVNSILWDGNVNTWQPPKGLRAVKSDDGLWRDGWKWDGAKAIDPNPPPPEEPPKEMPKAPSQPGMDVL